MVYILHRFMSLREVQGESLLPQDAERSEAATAKSGKSKRLEFEVISTVEQPMALELEKGKTYEPFKIESLV